MSALNIDPRDIDTSRTLRRKRDGCLARIVCTDIQGPTPILIARQVLDSRHRPKAEETVRLYSAFSLVKDYEYAPAAIQGVAAWLKMVETDVSTLVIFKNEADLEECLAKYPEWKLVGRLNISIPELPQEADKRPGVEDGSAISSQRKKSRGALWEDDEDDEE